MAHQPVPDTRYARSGEVHIAWQQFGDGPLDLLVVNGFATHIELAWEYEPWARLLRRVGTFARVVWFDRRGSGLSDRVPEAPTLEQRLEDVLAVLDAAGVGRAAVYGWSEGVALALLLAATHPDRVQALVCAGGMARATWAPDYPWAPHAEALEESMAELIGPLWGTGAAMEVTAPSRTGDPEARRFYARLERSFASPGMLGQLVHLLMETDVRDVVPAVRVPVLVYHRTHDRLVNVRHARWLAEHLPDARLLELPGDDHVTWWYEDGWLEEVAEFLTGARAAPQPRRALTTVCFTDVVGSTRTAAAVGDARWRAVLERHQDVVRTCLRDAGGREVKTLGDGFLLAFDGPAQAIRAAQDVVHASAAEGLGVRAGIHTGECEVLGEDLAGIAVHLAARVCAAAGDGEVLVSRTVRDLVAGSGIAFADRGEHVLKGVPGRWQLLAVA